MGQKLTMAGWTSIGFVAGALTTVQVQAVARDAFASLPLEELQQFAAVFEMIRTDYVEPVEGEKLIVNAISGMVAKLDPHSKYFDKESYAEFQDGATGSSASVGIEVMQEDGHIKIFSFVEGSPIDQHGLKQNDLITQIDGASVRGMTLNEVVAKLRGNPKTTVLLTIFRMDENRAFPVAATRDVIHTQSVRTRMMEPGYAWIHLSQFHERTVDDFVAKIEALYKQEPNMKGLVLDLRNDPGGLLEAAIAVSSSFLPGNLTVVSTNGQLIESKITYKSSPEFYQRRVGVDPLKRLPEALKSVPLVVLVNEGSASASEIVAGALQDYKRATIMGHQTFGKGSIQTMRPLGPDTGIKLTTARYYTPSGKSIQARGIIPDVLVDETAAGSPFSRLRTREADLETHINNSQGTEVKDAGGEITSKEATMWLPEKAKNALDQRHPTELGSDNDFPLAQAINQLKGRLVMVSKTAVVELKNVKVED